VAEVPPFGQVVSVFLLVVVVGTGAGYESLVDEVGWVSGRVHRSDWGMVATP
jgi:hypothetical protein